MVKKGPLNIVEKAAIQSFLSEGKELSDIADTLDRSEGLVSKYVDGELEDTVSTIAKAKMEAFENDQKKYSRARAADIHKVKEADNVEIDEVTDQKTFDVVSKRLKQAGLKENDVAKVMELAIKRFILQERKFKDENEFYSQCIKEMRAGEFMIKKSDGGRDGVAIMTPAASQRTDEAKKGYSAKIDNNIFRPNG